MERILLLHGRLQLTIAALLALLLLWGLACALLGRVGRGYLAGLWVAQLLIIAQCVLGLALVVGGARTPGLPLHSVYGVVAALCLPAALGYNRGRAGRWEALIYAAACLFLLGVVARAYQTAG
jgi:hypothetical protein